jgi:hypothetical protein
VTCRRIGLAACHEQSRPAIRSARGRFAARNVDAVGKVWDAVSGRFEPFSLTGGLQALSEMMEKEAALLAAASAFGTGGLAYLHLGSRAHEKGSQTESIASLRRAASEELHWFWNLE